MSEGHQPENNPKSSLQTISNQPQTVDEDEGHTVARLAEGIIKIKDVDREEKSVEEK